MFLKKELRAKSGNALHVEGREGAMVFDVKPTGLSPCATVAEGGCHTKGAGPSDVVEDPRPRDEE